MSDIDLKLRAVSGRHTPECHMRFKKFKDAKDDLVLAQALCPKCKARQVILRGLNNDPATARRR